MRNPSDVGVALGSDQAEMSKLERRPDMMLSTLRRYAEALGARCEVVFVFDKTGHRIVLDVPNGDEERRMHRRRHQAADPTARPTRRPTRDRHEGKPRGSRRR